MSATLTPCQLLTMATSELAAAKTAFAALHQGFRPSAFTLRSADLGAISGFPERSSSSGEDDELLRKVLQLVCRTQLAGDVPSLCALACVSTTTQAIVLLDSSLWQDLHLSDTAANLTEARLKTVITHAAGTLRSIDASHCERISDAGILFLSSQPQLNIVRLVGCPKLTAMGVHSALRLGPKLAQLHVSDICAGKGREEVELALLRSLVVEEGILDVAQSCSTDRCLRLCRARCEEEDGATQTTRSCDFCGGTFCGVCCPAVLRACDGACKCVVCISCREDHVATVVECCICERLMCAHCWDNLGSGSAVVDCAGCGCAICHPCCSDDGDDSIVLKCANAECGALLCGLCAAAADLLPCAQCGNYCIRCGALDACEGICGKAFCTRCALHAAVDLRGGKCKSCRMEGVLSRQRTARERSARAGPSQRQHQPQLAWR